MTAAANAPDPPRFPLWPGYLRMHWGGGFPVDVHWSALVGGVCLGGAGSFRPALLPPLIAGYLLLVLVHELGHAFAARRLGLRVHGIRLRGMGGHCVVDVPLGARATAIVYSAGLAAQLLLFGLALVASQVARHPAGETFGALIFVFTVGNAFAFLVGLCPWTSRTGQASDGSVLLRLAVDRWKGRTIVGGQLPAMNAQDESPLLPVETSLLARPELIPHGFVHGVEIFNDRLTPVAFVIDMLHRHLGLDGYQAMKLAVAIHNHGGLLAPLPSMEDAERVAAAVMADAAAAGHPLVCRAVTRTP